MGKEVTDTPVDVPKWDPALEALAREAYQRLGHPLGIDDFRRLGKEYQIRFHDMMATIYQLEVHGKWQHQGHDGAGNPVADDELYVHGRLDEKVAEKYAVVWSPVQ